MIFLNRNIAKFETWHKNCLYGLGEEEVRTGALDIPFQCAWLESSIVLEESNEDLTLQHHYMLSHSKH